MKKLMMMLAACAVAFTTFAAQCAAKTEDGAQCKREAVEGRKLCWQHAKAAGQCQAVTADGTKCKREAVDDGKVRQLKLFPEDRAPETDDGQVVRIRKVARVEAADARRGDAADGRQRPGPRLTCHHELIGAAAIRRKMDCRSDILRRSCI